MAQPHKYLLALLIATAFSVIACSSSKEDPQPRGPIVTQIPWSSQEEASYSLIDDDGAEVGQGVLTIQREGERFQLSQRYTSPTNTDETTAIVNATTFAPIEIERTIDGERGELHTVVNYLGGIAEIVRTSDEDNSSEQINVPENAYDNASALFLWRTIQFSQGARSAYTNALTAELQRPSLIDVSLRVTAREEITVPAGTFDTWRVEVTLSGQRQYAWYGAEGTRPLIKYDNGQYVFLLQTLTPP